MTEFSAPAVQEIVPVVEPQRLPEMIFIPGGTVRMGSDKHYPILARTLLRVFRTSFQVKPRWLMTGSQTKIALRGDHVQA